MRESTAEKGERLRKLLRLRWLYARRDEVAAWRQVRAAQHRGEPSGDLIRAAIEASEVARGFADRLARWDAV